MGDAGVWPGSTGARGRFAAVISSDDRPAKPRRSERAPPEQGQVAVPVARLRR
jgi:hypothetical protein